MNTDYMRLHHIHSLLLMQADDIFSYFGDESYWKLLYYRCQHYTIQVLSTIIPTVDGNLFIRCWHYNMVL